ncbi:CinA family protein [Desulfovibrio mangrovi]|nr:CinA family protein [Desulfovibrio mangrovi]UZP69205.1 CinA family protein [Desulfovibrio mangrovi]
MKDLHPSILNLGDMLRKRGMLLGTAESCTGGLIAAALTDVSGSSGWFAGGVVAYANEIKEQVLGVPHDTLVTHGAVSGETVEAMVRGATRVLGVDCAVAVSGIAGPSGGTPEKPVGTVWLAACAGEALAVRRFVFSGNRDAVRLQTVAAAVQELTTLIEAQ